MSNDIQPDIKVEQAIKKMILHTCFYQFIDSKGRKMCACGERINEL